MRCSRSRSASLAFEMGATEPVIEIEHVATRFGEHVVHSDVELEVLRGEIFALVGGSGSGKSTLLREMILLHTPDAGTIRLLGANVGELDETAMQSLLPRIGVMFQQGGLFGSLTVLENVGLPLREHTALDDRTIDEIAAMKIALTGLEPEAARQYPAELSGGMTKRAALARALALDPELLFLDEPTAGLDPTSAGGVDELVLHLREVFGLTVVMITHDLDLLWQVADRVAVLGDGRVQAIGSMDELSHIDLPAVRPFFEGARGASAAFRTSARGKEAAWKAR